MKQIIRENRIVFVYLLSAVLLELSAQAFIGASLHFTRFWVSILFLFVPISCLLSFKRIKTKKVLSMVFLIIQIGIIISTNFLYNATGTVFQKEMIFQRNDAFGTIEELNISIGLTIVCLLVLGIYIAMLVYDRKKKKWFINPFKSDKFIRGWALALSIISLCSFCIMPILYGITEKKKPDYHYKLSAIADGTQKYGSTTNIFYELVEFVASSGVNTSDMDTLEDFLYQKKAEKTPYFGVSEGNNLVMILVESFDTHVLERYSKEQTALLFPNITKLMDEGVYASNFRQKEKTDSSEVLSLLGTYPTTKFVNYGYEKNSYPFALPSLFTQKAVSRGVEAKANSFHHSNASFYNRNTLHTSMGFDKMFGIDDMLDYGMINEWDPGGTLFKKERSLDSLAMQSMKDEMFFEDENFFTYFITFGMHGFYKERENLKREGYYDRLDELHLFEESDIKHENYLRTYAASVMDFDRAVGIMLEDLEKKKILDKTTIVLFSDHNTYYNNLTEYAKGITNPLDVEGFRIPMIIYDQKLSAALDEKGESRTVDSFTTTSDLLPTVCDLLGIEIWQNFYLGSSIFNKETESIVYSRMYNFFFNDKLAFYSMDDLKFTTPDYLRSDLDTFIERAKIHLDKLYYIDKVFHTDYFYDHTYKLK